jgi:hypothetical protein
MHPPGRRSLRAESFRTLLEQGRITASGHVLDAVGRVLRLDAAGRGHLQALSESPGPPPAPVDVAGLVPLLESWAASPAVLLDHRLDVLAANRTWAGLFGDPWERDPLRRNLLWLLAAEPPAALEEADSLVRALGRRFRMAANMHAGDARVAEIGALLRAEAPEHGPLWDCRGVGAFGTHDVVTAGLPARAHLMRPGEHPGAAVLVLVPA